MTDHAPTPTGAADPPHQAIQTLLNETRRALQELEGQIEPLLVKRRVVMERLSALEHLDKLYRDPTAVGDEATSVGETRDGGASHALAPVTHIRAASGTSVRTTVRDRVKTILSESQDAMHINAIAQQFQERGWSIPGAGKPANLTAHMSNAPDIYSPRRGFWKIGENPEPATSTKTTKRKPRRRAGA